MSEDCILNQNELAILDCFFKTATNKTELGYVIFDQKPMNTIEYSVEQSFLASCCNDSIVYKVASSILKKINNKDNDYLIHINDRPSQYGWVDILVINKNLFLENVKNSLALFQYVLGSEITPESLLEQINKSDKSFMELLNYDRALIGIALGYGVENSINIARKENLQDHYLTGDNPPFNLPFNKYAAANKFFNNIFFIHDFEEISIKKLDKPGFGFKSFEEEFTALTSKTETASKQLLENEPRFVFGKLKSESNDKVKTLEETQREIQEFSNSKTFLRDILRKFYGDQFDEITLADNTSVILPFSPDEKRDLHLVLASKVSKYLSEESPEFAQGFLLGMEQANQGKELNVPSRFPLNVKYLRQAMDNLTNADLYFSKLSDSKEFHCVMPGKICYRTLEKKQLANDKLALEGMAQIKLRYSVMTPNGKILASTDKPVEISMENLLPAIVHGMQGMQLNEKREIYIHPSVGYGIYTNIEKGIYLTVNVELVSILNKDDMPLPEITTYDFEEFKSKVALYEDAKVQQDLGVEEGYSFWEYYKKSPDLSYKELTEQIALLQKGKANSAQYPNEDELITRVQWNIYQIESNSSS